MSTSSPDNTVRKEIKLDVGVYGTTYAGKTRFFYELLHWWHTNHRFGEKFETEAQNFLSSIEQQLEEARRLIRTRTWDQLEVTVRPRAREHLWIIKLRDLPGDQVHEQVDELDPTTVKGQERKKQSERTNKSPLDDQVEQCNVFLFFLNPCGTTERDCENCDKASQDTKIADRIIQHLDTEKDRAKTLIDRILSTRQNEHLPLVFVVTHRDCWEADSFVCKAVERWLNEVNEEYRNKLQNTFGDLYPKALLRNNSFRLSSVEEGDKYELEKVFERLVDMRQECDQLRSRFKVPRWLIVGLVVMVFTIAGLILFTLNRPPRPVPSCDNWETLVTRKIDLLTEKELNEHMNQMIDLWRHCIRDKQVLNEDDTRSFEDSMRRVAQYILTRAKNTPASLDELEKLQNMLAGIEPGKCPGAEKINQACSEFWDKLADAAVKELRGQIDSSNSPRKNVQQLRDACREFRDRFEASQVAGTSQQRRILAQVKKLETFASSLLEPGKYRIDIKISGRRPAARTLLFQFYHGKKLAKSIGVLPRASTQGTDFEVAELFDVYVGEKIQIKIYEEAANNWIFEQEVELSKDNRAFALLGVIGVPAKGNSGPPKEKKVVRRYGISIEFTCAEDVPDLLYEILKGRPSNGRSR